MPYLNNSSRFTIKCTVLAIALLSATTYTMRLLFMSRVFSLFSSGKPSSLRMSLSEKSTVSNWSCKHNQNGCQWKVQKELFVLRHSVTTNSAVITLAVLWSRVGRKVLTFQGNMLHLSSGYKKRTDDRNTTFLPQHAYCKNVQSCGSTYGVSSLRYFNFISVH